MDLPEYFISCDWGTTKFRLRLVKTSSLEVLSELKTDVGIRVCHDQFGAQNVLTQQDFFGNYLSEQIRSLPLVQDTQPIIVSGMASSSIGMCELPYADFPFDPSGQDLPTLQCSIDGDLTITLVSGIKSESGMMRGEEVQAMGISEGLRDYKEGTLVLPGTHSKHMKYRAGKFIKLTNFMTGELFEVLSKHSILAKSVANTPWSASASSDFHEGLSKGFSGRLTSSLLMVRLRDVVLSLPQANNYYFLSGLLIGDEIKSLRDEKGAIFLAAPDPIYSIYKSALETLFDQDKIVFFDDTALEKALLVGQRKILAYHG